MEDWEKRLEARDAKARAEFKQQEIELLLENSVWQSKDMMDRLRATVGETGARRVFGNAVGMFLECWVREGDVGALVRYDLFQIRAKIGDHFYLKLLFRFQEGPEGSYRIIDDSRSGGLIRASATEVSSGSVTFQNLKVDTPPLEVSDFGLETTVYFHEVLPEIALPFREFIKRGLNTDDLL